MPWCPECHVEYRDGFFRCADCGAWLTNRSSPEAGRSPNAAADPEEDYPASWARSTLTSPFPGGRLVEVYTAEGGERFWLHDILDDNGIPYQIETLPCESQGHDLTIRFIQSIYVEERDKDAVKGYIDEYQDEKNIVWEETGEEDDLDGSEDAPPQIKCPHCGEDIDFDYVICPLCDKRLISADGSFRSR